MATHCRWPLWLSCLTGIQCHFLRLVLHYHRQLLLAAEWLCPVDPGKDIPSLSTRLSQGRPSLGVAPRVPARTAHLWDPGGAFPILGAVFWHSLLEDQNHCSHSLQGWSFPTLEPQGTDDPTFWKTELWAHPLQAATLRRQAYRNNPGTSHCKARRKIILSAGSILQNDKLPKQEHILTRTSLPPVMFSLVTPHSHSPPSNLKSCLPLSLEY